VTLLAALMTVSAALGGCQSSSGGLASALSGSASGMPIAVESIEGAPDGVQTALAGELAQAAAARKVDMVSAGQTARFRIRGYLSTERAADGTTALAFVWDVFDASNKRARRVTGSKPMPAATATDPWHQFDREALRKLAVESMDGIAGFLVASAQAPDVQADDDAGDAQAALGFTAR
jgi:hypothetical protein